MGAVDRQDDATACTSQTSGDATVLLLSVGSAPATVRTLAPPPCTPWLRPGHRAHPGSATVYTLATPPSTRLTQNLSSWPATLNWCDRACVADGSFIRRVAYGEKNKARVLFVHTQNVCRSNVTCNFARCLPIIRVLRSIGLSMPRYGV